MVGTGRRLAAVILVAMAAACGGPVSPALTTGLTGTVLRGPIGPVCTPGASCDAPFSAHFSVERNANRVAQFQSDAQGRFTVRLAPGAYRVIPDPDAPIIFPASQATDVEVGRDGLTAVVLHFDTGIR